MYIKYSMGDFSPPAGNLYIKYTMGNFEPLASGSNSKDAIKIADSVYTQLVRSTRINSTLEILDTIVTSIGKYKSTPDIVTISDTVLISLSYNISGVSELTITDSSIAHIILPKHSSDELTIVESISVLIYETRGKSKDTVDVIDSTIKTLAINRGNLNTIAIIDSNIAFFTGFIVTDYVEELSIIDTAITVIFAPTLISTESQLTIVDSSYTLITHNNFVVTTVTVSEQVSTFVNTAPISKSLVAVVDILDYAVPKLKQYKTASGVLVDIKHTDIFLSKKHVLISSLATTQITLAPEWVVNNLTGLAGELPKLYNTDSNLYVGHINLDTIELNKFELQTVPTNSIVDYGFIKYITTESFIIKSGAPIDITITEIIIPAYFGITVELLAGDILLAGGQLEFNIIAHDGVGRPIVNDFFTIHFTNGQMIKIWVRITRQRVFDLAIAPDKGQYSESISFLTKVFDSLNNVTNTEPLMEQYKYSCKYQATAVHTRKHRAFLNIFREALSVPVVHPLWGQTSVVTTYAYDSAVVYCNTVGVDFRVGRQIYIFKNADEYIRAFVVSISDGGLVIDRKITTYDTWFVTPSFMGIAKGVIKTSYSSELYAKMDIEVEEFYPYA